MAASVTETRSRGDQTGFATLRRVTNHPSTSAVRRAARVLALAPALARDRPHRPRLRRRPPSSWEDTAAGARRCTRSWCSLVIPLGLFVLITLLVYLPSMLRGEQLPARPGLAQRARVVRRPAQRRRGRRRAAAAPPASTAETHGRGGTSGRW